MAARSVHSRTADSENDVIRSELFLFTIRFRYVIIKEEPDFSEVDLRWRGLLLRVLWLWALLLRVLLLRVLLLRVLWLWALWLRALWL